MIRRTGRPLFYLPQLARVYYRTLPPLDGDAALRSTLAEEFLLRVARRSFRFALQLAWLLVSYLEDRRRARLATARLAIISGVGSSGGVRGVPSGRRRRGGQNRRPLGPAEGRRRGRSYE